jgi:hypothetical protein
MRKQPNKRRKPNLDDRLSRKARKAGQIRRRRAREGEA